MDNTAISLEQLRKVLESKGLDIKELAKEAKELELDTNKTETSKNKRASNSPVFEVSLVSYPDIVIRKSTAKTEKMMVLMISQNSYYIKTIKDGFEVKEKLSEENYSTFTSGMKYLELPKDFWITYFKSGKKSFKNLYDLVLNNKPVRDAIIGRYYINNEDIFDENASYRFRLVNDMYTKIPLLLKDGHFKKEYVEYWYVFNDIQNKFGVDNARDFIKELELSLINQRGLRMSNLSYLLDDYDFKYESFKNYMLYDSVRFGYAYDMHRFVSTWKDTLDMQKKLWGKVKEKYPEHLTEFHDQLSYKCLLMYTQINEKRFKERVKDSERFEAVIGDYTFISPKIPQDFYDEAIAQNNCLAGYVEKYAEGKDYIFFMRRKETPEESLVTIELDLDGSLRQAYQARNKNVSLSQKVAIEEWMTKVVMPVLNAQSQLKEVI